MNVGQKPSIWEGELSVVGEPTWTTPWWTLKAGSSIAAVHLFHHVSLATGYGNNPFSSNPEGKGYDPSLQPLGDGRVALNWPFDTENLGLLFVARPGLSRKIQEKTAQREMLPWRANIDWCSRQYLVGIGSTEEEASRGLQQLLCAAGGWIDRPYKKEEIQGLIVKQFLWQPPQSGFTDVSVILRCPGSWPARAHTSLEAEDPQLNPAKRSVPKRPTDH